VTQQYAPDSLVGVDYYTPTDHGAEREVAARLPKLRALVRGKSGTPGSRSSEPARHNGGPAQNDVRETGEPETGEGQ
jgi:putative ATPase